MKNLLAVSLAVFSFAGAASPLDYPSVWQCDANKPNWYCDAQQERELQAQKAPVSQPKPTQGKRIEIKDIRTAEQLRFELKRREDLMVMNPSDSNLVKDYLELWQVTQDKGSMLADTWRRVVWQNPELDYSLRRPVNNSAIKTFDERRGGEEEKHLKQLSKEHGLIFFFKSDCPYCHAMAPVLKMLNEKYGIEVLAVSIDGGGLPDFPRFTDGRKNASAWGIERVPALFIGSKKTGERAPVGFGQMAYSEIVDRIFVLTGTKPGQNF